MNLASMQPMAGSMVVFYPISNRWGKNHGWCRAYGRVSVRGNTVRA